MSTDGPEWDDIDWKAFQKLVAGLHADDDTIVATEYEYPVNSGGTKEVDVVVWDSSQHYEYIVLIECRNHSTPLSQSHVDEVYGYFQDTDADKAVIVSRNGFQSGAIKRARGTGVKLLTVRELIPGTDIDVDAMQYVNTNIEITVPRIEVNSIYVQPLDAANETEQRTDVQITEKNDQLYNLEREVKDNRLLERLTDWMNFRDPGVYTEEFEDTAILVEGKFYKLNSIEFEITETTTSQEFTVDMFEEFDTVLIDELTGEVEYRSLSEAIRAFEK